MEDILLQIRKPARYIGKEWLASTKDFDKAAIKFALCFPDLYEIGMSNLGIRILYDLLNKIPDVACERFFSYAIDLQELIIKDKKTIVSLESGKPLKEFDLVGFSLGYELNYTNVLKMLELGGIPLKACLRKESDPLIIGGGPCVANPEPMACFFDLFVIGEAEEALLEIIDIYRSYKNRLKDASVSREGLLLKLAGIEGVYVPSLYEVSYDDKGKIKAFLPKFPGLPAKIKKRFVQDLNKADFPLDWLVPYIQITHDRITLEVMRGCPNKCRFCQARTHYFPFRERKASLVVNLASEIYKRTGYEEISLTGLSVSDYSGIKEVLESLITVFKEKAVSISLPSIKPKIILEYLSGLIASIKKTSLTFAPEAASERLRNILAKDFDMDSFYKVIEKAYSTGYQHVKLYFMIGIPYEQDKDLEEIISFSENISALRKKIGKGSAEVNISINTLIPKPHTPFQWLAMQDLETTKSKQAYIKSKIKSKKLKVDFHHCYMSFLEGIISRGDRRIAQVILRAYELGARFDSWDEYFLFDLWMKAFKESGLEPDFYLQARSKEEILPWDFLDMGVGKEYLLQEENKIKPVAIE